MFINRKVAILGIVLLFSVLYFINKKKQPIVIPMPAPKPTPVVPINPDPPYEPTPVPVPDDFPWPPLTIPKIQEKTK